MKTQFRIAAVVAVAILAGFLVSCGGSSGGGGSTGTPPTITTTSLPAAISGTAYTATIMVTGGTAPLTFSVSSGTLPPGLALSTTTGAISGTPSTQGTFTFTVKVTDSSSPVQTAMANLSILVNAPPPVLTITTTALPGATTGVPYSAQIMTSGGVPPITFTVTSGTLPAGLMLSASGLISGTPTTLGTSAFTVQAADSAVPPQTASAPLEITVTSAQFMFVTTSLPDGYVAFPYSAQIMTSGGVPPITFTVTSGTLPAGLMLSASGLISGTPTTLGTSAFTVQATDSSVPPQTASAPLEITVTSGSAAFDGPYAFQAAGFDPSNNPVAYVGSFTADGIGNITGGTEDTNDNGVIGSSISFTGTFGIAADDRGTLILNLATTPPTTQKFAFAMSSTGQLANIIEFDQVNQASGTFQKADPTAFSLANLAGDYAFGLTTNQPAVLSLGARSGQIGRFTLDSSGDLSVGAADTNNNGTSAQDTGLTGSFAAPNASSGRGTASLTPGTQPPIGLIYYIVQQGVIFALENDANGGTSVYSGSIMAQQGAGSFTANSLSGPVVFEAAGVDVGGSSVIAGQFTATPTTLQVAGEFDENDAGLVVNAMTLTGTYVAPDPESGRGTFSLVGSNQIHYLDAVFYLTGTNTGFILDGAIPLNNYIRSGMIQPQTGGPFTSAPNDGDYYGGSLPPSTAGPLPSGKAVAIPNIDDQFSLSLLGQGLTGIGDVSFTDFINTVELTGTYTFGDAFGRATVDEIQNGFGDGLATIYLVTPTQFVLIPTNQFGQASDVAVFQAQ